MNPKVSIIIPVYNTEEYLRSCLDSVISQTLSDIEIICVNDGSSDYSLDILSEYAKRDSRIKIITQDNRGLSEARNRGLNEATGDYIFFVDSDDFIHSQCLETAYSLAKENDADLVDLRYTSRREMAFLSRTVKIRKVRCKVASNPFSLGINKERFKILFFVWTKLYRRIFLRGLRFIPNIQFEDFPFVFGVLSKMPKTVVALEKLYFYRARPNSISCGISPKQISDYHAGIRYIYKAYKSSPEGMRFLRSKFIPIILKHQLHRCENAPKNMRESMYKEFSAELKDLCSIGLISWQRHNIFRYFKYRRLLSTYA